MAFRKKWGFPFAGTVAVFLLVMGCGSDRTSVADAASLTWSADYIVDLSNPDIDVTILSGSKAENLTVDTGTVQVAVANGDVFTVTSASRGIDTSGNTTAAVSNSCTSGVATVVITGGSGGETITLTPASGACTTGGNANPSGGGILTIIRPTPAPTPVVPPTTGPNKPLSQMTIGELQAELARLVALLALFQSKAGESPAPACSAPFTRDLFYGLSDDAEVKRMQELFISKGHLAVGYNTGNYLILTRNAVRSYQASQNITPLNGRFGPLTRAAANADCGR